MGLKWKSLVLVLKDAQCIDKTPWLGSEALDPRCGCPTAVQNLAVSSHVCINQICLILALNILRVISGELSLRPCSDFRFWGLRPCSGAGWRLRPAAQPMQRATPGLIKRRSVCNGSRGGGHSHSTGNASQDRGGGPRFAGGAVAGGGACQLPGAGTGTAGTGVPEGQWRAPASRGAGKPAAPPPRSAPQPMGSVGRAALIGLPAAARRGC